MRTALVVLGNIIEIKVEFELIHLLLDYIISMADGLLHEIRRQAFLLSGGQRIAFFIHDGEALRATVINHTGTPQIHISEQRMDRSTRPTSLVGRITTIVNGGRGQHGFHLVDQRVHDLLAGNGLFTCHKRFRIGADRMAHERNVAERANEIEIIECTQTHHFGLHRLPLYVGERRISAFINHLLTVFQHLITEVDALVEGRPVIKIFGGLKHCLLHISIVGFTHVAELHVVRAELAPRQDFTGALRQLVVGGSTHVVYVVARIPEFLFCNRGRGIEREVILAGGHTTTQHDYGAGHQQLFEYFTVHDVLELWRWKTTSFFYAKYV